MPDYEINTFAELCQRIIDSDGKGVENLVAVTSPGAFACTIKIEGASFGVLSRVAKVLWIWCFVWLFSAWA